jgi:hypothetical protein
MTELLVRIKDKKGDPSRPAGTVIAQLNPGDSWGRRDLTNPEWKVIKVDGEIPKIVTNALLPGGNRDNLFTIHPSIYLAAGVVSATALLSSVESRPSRREVIKYIGIALTAIMLAPTRAFTLSRFVTSTIGTGGDYSTSQAWEDALPADLVTDANSYVGEMFDQEFTASCSFSAHTTNATFTVTLTAAAGASYIDDASVRTNALKYNASNGVGISRTGGYQQCIEFTGIVDYITITRLQLKTSHAKSVPISPTSGCNHNTYKNLILQTNNDGTTAGGTIMEIYGTVSKIFNIVVVQSHATGACIVFGNSLSATGCTFMRITDNTPAGNGVVARNYSTPTIISCALFGFTTPAATAGNGTWTSCKNCATDAASGLPGTSNQHSVTYSSTTPFTGGSTATLDLRAIASTSLIDNGFEDATNAPEDISGTDRTTTPTIGAWEVVAGATFPAAIIASPKGGG